MAYPNYSEEEKINREYDVVASVLCGVWLFFVIVRPVMIYFHLL